jgi:hypothetical protein
MCKDCSDTGRGRTSHEASAGCSSCIKHWFWDNLVGCDSVTGDPEFSNDTDDSSGVNNFCCKPCSSLNGFDIDESISSVICEAGARLDTLVLNPGWWRHSLKTTDILQCTTSDCRSRGGPSSKKQIFGNLRATKNGEIKHPDFVKARGNGSGVELCQDSSHGPLCSVSAHLLHFLCIVIEEQCCFC